MDSKRSNRGFCVESLRGNTGSFQINKDDESNTFRKILSQVLATVAINLILFDIGLALSYPTIVVPLLLAKNSSSHGAESTQDFEYNVTQTNGSFSFEPDEISDIHEKDPFHEMSYFRHYTMTEYETTWYVSIAYVCQPIGSIIGGSIISFTGRKRLMQALNVFMFFGWILPFFSTGPIYMYLSNSLLGIGIGCCEAPIATYLGETIEVSYRGFLLNLAQMCLSVSFLVPYLLSYVTTSWRWQALFISSLPVITFAYCFIIPETPVWLLSKGRFKEAENSLRWLRGWTCKENIQDELDEINSLHRQSSTSKQSSDDPNKATEEQVKKEGYLMENVRYFFSPRMLNPFFIICTMFSLMFITGMGAIRPYMIIIFKEINIVMDPNQCAMWVTFAGAVGNGLSLFLIKFTGKRMMVLPALFCSGICTLLIALIKMNLISHNFSFVTFLAMSFCSGYGIIPLPWMLQSELYPFRGRGVASGIGAAFCYIVGFISTNIYLNLSHTITFQGVFFLFTFFSLYGFIFLWFKLPETEGKTFEEINQYFSNKKK